MGDPKQFRKKYLTPAHPWSRIAIDEERQLVQQYGLKKKKEIYIANSFLKKYKDLAKKLIAAKTAQGRKEQQQMMSRLQRLGLLSASAKLDGVLSLQLKDVLERRLQSQVVRKGLVRTMNQARQLITHRHIVVGEVEITSPSYLISLEEEGKLLFKMHSPFADENHPERTILIEEEKTASAPAAKDAEKAVAEEVVA